jgi:uncharacterized protein
MAVTHATQKTTSSQTAGLGLIDSDVHPHFSRGMGEIAPYLSAAWRKKMHLAGQQAAWAKEVPASQYALPRNDTYLPTPGAMRRDASPTPGAVPASDPKYVVKHLLDRYHIDRAVLIGGNVLGVSSIPDPAMAAAVASAYNDWLAETWLSVDERYRQAAVIAANNPMESAAEIRRVAQRPGVVALMMPVADSLVGEASFNPIYDAAEEAGLPILLHLTGTESIFRRSAQFPGGPPTFYIEWHACVSTIYQANVVSLVCQGVFERFPKLKVAVVEGGVAWLLDVMWRLDKDWRALRDEVPWVKKLPSEYIHEHIKFTTQPMLEPKTEDLLRFIEMTNAQDLLMFSSDYPHWDFDNPMVSLKGLPVELRHKIEFQNAASFYGTRLTGSLRS